jgi:hypothetical protein
MRFEIIDGWTITLEEAVLYAALLIILLLLLRISGRLRRILNIIEPRRDRQAGDQPAAKSNRYMREDTLAEFLERHKKDGQP